MVVGPVSVPAVVDRPQIVVTTGPNQVRPEEFNRWASPLQNNISRVVAENLVALLGTPRVILFSQTLGGDADYRAAIEVQRFESAPGEAATLDAVWTVSRAKDGKSQTGRTTVREATIGQRLRRACCGPQPRARAAEPGHRRRRAERSSVPASRRSKSDEGLSLRHPAGVTLNEVTIEGNRGNDA